MIILIWLIHLDRRWFCSLTCPIIHSMWLFAVFYCIVMSFFNIYALYKESPCPILVYHLLFNTIVLLVQGILCQLIYNRTLLKLGKKQLEKYEERQDIIHRLTNWTVKKTLLSKLGYTVFFIGIIQNLWAINALLNKTYNLCQGMQSQMLKLNVILTLVASIPIIFILGCYILIKTLTLVTSSLFPHTYIKIKKCFTSQ